MTRSLSPKQITVRKAALVDAAMEILESEGHQALTVRNLAEKAGMSRSTPYLYYENKDALLDAVRARCFRDLTKSCRAVAENGDQPVAQMRQLGEIYIRFGLNHPVLYELIFLAARSFECVDEELHAAIDDYSRVSSKPLDAAYEAGLVTMPPERLNPVLWSALHGLLRLHRLGHLGSDDALERIHDDLDQVLCTGFLARK